MPIHVICPSCHARFKVGDQHAGKTGACPRCKGQIQIPAVSDEVVIHEPELEAGAKNVQGRNVLKPLKRKEAKFQLNTALVVGGAALLTFAIAFLVGRQQELSESAKTWILIVGAVLLGPPLAHAGYSFLRDDEQGAYVGKDLLVRALACGLVYALTWGVYWYVGSTYWGDLYTQNQLELFQVGILVAIALGIGTFTAFVSFDFDPITGFFHFALYFGLTVLLRATIGWLTLLPGIGGSTTEPPQRTPGRQTTPAKVGQNDVQEVFEFASPVVVGAAEQFLRLNSSTSYSICVACGDGAREFVPRNS